MERFNIIHRLCVSKLNLSYSLQFNVSCCSSVVTSSLIERSKSFHSNRSKLIFINSRYTAVLIFIASKRTLHSKNFPLTFAHFSVASRRVAPRVINYVRAIDLSGCKIQLHSSRVCTLIRKLGIPNLPVLKALVADAIITANFGYSRELTALPNFRIICLNPF